MPPKIAFQILGTQKLHLGNQAPGSRKFSCPASSHDKQSLFSLHMKTNDSNLNSQIDTDTFGPQLLSKTFDNNF